MAVLRRARLARASAAALILVTAALTAGLSRGRSVHAAPAPAASASIVLAFGSQGGNMRPLRVTIDSTGTVTLRYRVAGVSTSRHLFKDTLAGLLTLARAEGFFTLPPRMIGHGLPDIGGRYITIHTATATKTVAVRFVRNAAFDQLYAVPSAVAGLPT